MVHSKNIDSLEKVLARLLQLSYNGHLTRSATHGAQPCSLKINSSASPKSMPAKLVNSVNEEKEEEEEKKDFEWLGPPQVCSHYRDPLGPGSAASIKLKRKLISLARNFRLRCSDHRTRQSRASFDDGSLGQWWWLSWKSGRF